MGLTILTEHKSIPRTKYYECHITIDPVDELDDERYSELRQLAGRYGFRVAELLMKKSRANNPEDSFMTARNVSYEGMKKFMELEASSLNEAGFNIRRMKIEAVVYDEHF